jgi:hypothetical protein
LETLPNRGALKQAIYFALHGQMRGIGDSFVMLFAGIETLLNLFQEEGDIEPLFPTEQWHSLFGEISSLLGTQKAFLALQPDMQSKLLKNIQGANRAFFADRFDRMCLSKGIDLRDLWPMLGGKGSLYGVRNRIAHGSVFADDQEWFRVIPAKFHLLWTLERSILCILGWPVERSRSSAKALRLTTLYAKWRGDREYFATTK